MVTAAPQTHWSDRGAAWVHRAAEVMSRPRLMFKTVGVTAASLTAAGILQTLGPVSSLVIAALMAAVVGTVVAWRRNSSNVLAVAWTLAYSGVVLAVGASLSWATMLGGGFAYLSAYLTGLAAIAVLVLRSPRTSVSPAVTTFLAQTALMATLPVQLLTSSASAPIGGFILAAGVIWWRNRLAARTPLPHSRGRRTAARVWKVVTGVVAAVLMAATVLLGTATPAGAWGLSSITGAITDSVQQAMCGMTAPSLEQQPVGSGPEAWFSNQNLAGARDAKTGAGSDFAKDISLATDGDMTQYTLYEISGLRGLDWVNWQYSPDASGDAKPDQCSIPAWMWTMSGNAIFTVNLYILQATIALKELAQSTNPVAWLYNTSNSVVANVFVNVALPLMAIAMVLSAITVGFAAIRGGGRDSIGKAVASFGVMILAGVMFGGIIANKSSKQSMENPEGSGFYIAASTMDSMIGELNSMLTTGILSTLNEDDGAEFCHVPPGETATLGQRVSSCVLAETLAYRPWALGQFGPGGNKPINIDEGRPLPDLADGVDGKTVRGVRYGESAAVKADSVPCYVNLDMCRDLRTYLIVQQGGPAIGDKVVACLGEPKASSLGDAQQCIPYFAAGKVLADRVTAASSGGDNPDAGEKVTPTAAVDATTMYSAFTGTNGLQRLTQAASSLVATLVIAVALTTLSIITMAWHVLLFVLFMVGVFILAVASFSGKTQMAKDWVFDVVHTFTARFVYGLMMTLIIWVICLVFRSESIYTGMKIIIVGMVLFGFLKLIRKIDEKIKPKQGSMNVNMADQTRRGMTVAKGAAGYMGFKGAQRLSRAPGAVARGTGSAVKKGGQATKSTVSAGGRMLKGATVGSINALGGEHKANIDAARAQGQGSGRVMARRLVTAPLTGTGGAIRGAYQGARGNTPTYNGEGTNRAVDGLSKGTKNAVRIGKDAKFQAQYQAMRAQDAVGRRLNPSRQVAAENRQREREAQRSTSGGTGEDQ